MGKIVIIGSGHMGRGMAAVFLACGHEVVVLGRDPQRVAARFDLIRALTDGLGAAGGPGPVSTTAGTLSAGAIDSWNEWAGTALVLETISEQLALKQALFAELDRRVPADIPIGTNSSGHGIDEMSAGLATAGRMLNVHYSMPAHIVPMVEVALGTQTDLALAQRVCALIESTGKKTTLIRRYIPGLLITRLQHALMREALSLVDQGIVTSDDIDAAVRFGFGFRYAALGPMAQKELSGWDTHVVSGQSVYPSLSNITMPPRCVTDLVQAGRFGIKTGAGFKDWTEAESARFQQNCEARLQAALQVLSVAPD